LQAPWLPVPQTGSPLLKSYHFQQLETFYASRNTLSSLSHGACVRGLILRSQMCYDARRKHTGSNKAMITEFEG
jgi:hypothetical protein